MGTPGVSGSLRSSTGRDGVIELMPERVLYVGRGHAGERVKTHAYPRRTSTMKVSSWRAILPVISQQPSVGKAMPLAWNPDTP